MQADASDIPDILRLIRDLARFERLEHEVSAREESLRQSLFGARRYAEVVFAEDEHGRAGFALFFHNYSTFIGKPGLYLEDLYVRPEKRGLGYAKALLRHLAQVALVRGCGRIEWWRMWSNATATRMKAPMQAPCQNALMPSRPRLLRMISIGAEPTSAPKAVPAGHAIVKRDRP